jgi:hypothetical protein
VDPPEHELYPVVDELLADFQADQAGRQEGVRVVAHRW